MRLLFLTHSFNSLTQRLYAELGALGHEVSVEFDIADSVAEEAVALFRPDLVIAPYLRRAIPASIWSQHVCLVVHPGIVGDRGPSALDWAIQRGETEWGVTVLQANAVMDGGDVWAHETFPLRAARKASVYRNEVTAAACRAIKAALDHFADYRRGSWRPTPLAAMQDVRGHQHALITQADRAIDWSRETTATVLARINAADGFPGVRDSLFGEPCQLFDACAESVLRGRPGELIARRESALCRATVDGAVWIGHVKRQASPHPFKLPATLAFAAEAATLPEAILDGWWRREHATWQDMRYEEGGDKNAAVGVLSFDFYNGAMNTRQCERLRAAYAFARSRPTRLILLAGGSDFWSNGIHLNVIEAGGFDENSSVADESLANINAINDLAHDIITTGGQLTVAALQGNTGAGGCFLARACDQIWARDGVILNPHYKNMGNLFGSEYWTYLLPKRVGEEKARAIMQHRLPLPADAALACGLIDAVLPGDSDEFRRAAAARADALARAPDFATQLAKKIEQRHCDEMQKPLASYRAEELAQMRRNFYGFDPSYHVARYHFVLKSPASWTPRHLARHRDLPAR
ncbi:MAG TPA: hydrogenase maturation protein [Rhodocyclaceae bacterium]|nr:hydrogenase maturation protein [Rhodocyclaceae bacterium]